jgi:hypothetical protein
MLSISGLNVDFVTALLEHDLRAGDPRLLRRTAGILPASSAGRFFRIELRLDAVEKRSHDRP